LLKRDLTEDSTSIELSSANFDFGIRLDYLLHKLEPYVDENLDEYVDLRITENIFTWTEDDEGEPVFNKTKYRMTMVPCMKPRLGQTQGKKDFLGIQDGYFCP
jgi:hypothetical protein